MKRPLVGVTLVYAGGLLLAECFQPPLTLLFTVSLGLAAAALCLARARPWLIWPLVLFTGWTNLVWRTATVSPHDLRLTQGETARLVSIQMAHDPDVPAPGAEFKRSDGTTIQLRRFNDDGSENVVAKDQVRHQDRLEVREIFRQSRLNGTDHMTDRAGIVVTRNADDNVGRYGLIKNVTDFLALDDAGHSVLSRSRHHRCTEQDVLISQSG